MNELPVGSRGAVHEEDGGRIVMRIVERVYCNQVKCLYFKGWNASEIIFANSPIYKLLSTYFLAFE